MRRHFRKKGLALPEHRVCLPRDAHQTNVKAAWGLFSVLKFDIVRYNDEHVCKQNLDLVDRKESSRASLSPISESEVVHGR